MSSLKRREDMAPLFLDTIYDAMVSDLLFEVINNIFVVLKTKSKTCPICLRDHGELKINEHDKEPSEIVPCSYCNRKISSNRFALHLDKCMGRTALKQSNKRRTYYD